MNDFSSFLDNLSLEQLVACRKQIDGCIDSARKEHRRVAAAANVHDFVSTPAPLLDMEADDVEYASLYAALDSLSISKSTRPGCATQWFTSTGQSYVWETSAGTPVVKDPKPIEEYGAINNTLEKLNVKLNLDLNSCLVSYFPDGRSTLRLHNDNEDSMDSTQPIVVVTIGSSRTVDFLGAYQPSSTAPALSITPETGSFYVMKPGCQEFFKHRVLANKNTRGPRYSLSFRCMKVAPSLFETLPIPKPTLPSTSPTSVKGIFSQLFRSSSSANVGKQSPPPGTGVGKQPPPLGVGELPPLPDDIPRKGGRKGVRKRTTVLFGTSITESIVGKRLGNKGRTVINVSESGADIKMIEEMVDDFALYDPAASDIEKVVLCFGTNDIKHSSKGVAHLKTPVFNLINKVKYCFPGAVVLVISNLPMKNMYWYTCQNFINFNEILKDVCHKSNSYFVDCFRNFLSDDMYDYNHYLFRDPWHLNRRGLGIFCSILKTVINCDTFSAIIRTEYGYFNQRS